MMRRVHVTILGLGGIGRVVLSHLVSAGVQNFSLVDHDDVHIDDFNRQYLFTRADPGRSKAEAARDWVLCRAPEARVDVFRARITARSQRLGGTAALVLAADEPHGAIPLIAGAYRTV
jgi:molybdopterin/thiamine biosynthesis adenylyltransferase